MSQSDSEFTQRISQPGTSTATANGKDVSLVSTHQLEPIAGSNGYQQHIAFDPSQPLDLSVTNVNGSIKVKSSDEQTIWLVVRRLDKAGDAPLNLTVSVEGNKISIHPDWQLSNSLAGLAKKIRDQLKNGIDPGDWNLSRLRFGNDFDFDIRLEVPRNLMAGSKVGLRTTSGTIEVDHITADVSCASASGSVQARELEGGVSLHTASGSVKVENVRGSLEVNTASGSIKVNGGEAWTALRTVSGSIEVDNYTLRNAKFASVSGSMKLNAIANNALAPYGFDTVSGSVNLDLRLPAAASGPSLHFRSVSGSGSAGGDWKSTGKRNWVVGNGEGASFRVNTVSGSLNTKARLDDSVVARNEPLPNSDRYNDDQPTEPVDDSRNFDINVDFDRGEIGRAVNWAKEAAKRFTQPLEGQEAPPATPSVPPTPAGAPPVPPTPPNVRNDLEMAAADIRAASANIDAELANAESEIAGAEAEIADVEAEIADAEAVIADAHISSQTNSVNPTEERPEDEEALKVLESLERGEIDIEEALARIERAENPTP